MDFSSGSTWAITAKNTPIQLFFSQNFKFKSGLRPLLFMGGVHGDEPEGVRLAKDFLNYLIADEKKGQIFCPWLLIPCLNPDGFLAKTRTNSRGVDLNRNYPASNWSKEHKEARYFPGEAPGSELETQAVVRLIQEETPRLIVHFHSWKPMIVARNKKAFKDAQKLVDASGYPFEEEIGYPTPGSLSSFAGDDLDLPVICIEEIDPCPLDEVWGHFAKGLINIVKDSSLRRE